MQPILDSTRPDFQERAFGVYRLLRDEHPVYHDPGRSFWALSRYEDVFAAANDDATFSSESTPSGMGEYPQIQALDSPYHDQLRALLSAAFSPRRTAALEPRIRSIACELLDRVADEGHCDLKGDFAGLVPNRVISELIGIPPERQAAFLHEAEALVEQGDPTKTHADTLLGVSKRLAALFAELVEERRRARRDDLMSALLDVEIDGRKLSLEEILGFCTLLVTAGTDTVMGLVTNGAARLAEHPDQRRLLAEDFSRIPLAVEEMLRYDSPAQLLWRVAARDVELHGVKIPKGGEVHLLWGSANHDERVFDDPERFDVTRETRVHHLAFGIGRHYCLGASLARLEARVMFEELLRRFPEYEIAGEPRWLPSLWARAYASLPVRFAA